MQTGHLKAVKNKDRRFGSADEYVFVTVEQAGDTLPLLFTHEELKRAGERALLNREDWPEETKECRFNLKSLLRGWGLIK